MDDVLYELRGAAAVLTLNRPERMNGWNPAMDVAFREAVDRAAAEPQVRAIVVTGAGRAFCAGADLSRSGEFTSAKARESMARAATAARESAPTGIERNYRGRFARLAAVPKPVIAAVNGAAAGIGLALTLSCDMRFAGESARFATAFTRLGLPAESGTQWFLPRMVGMGAAFDMLCSGRMVGAQEAHAIRLVERLFPDAELLAATLAYVEAEVTRASPAALAATKKLMWDAQFQDLADALAADHAATLALRDHPDLREGIAAFKEKRAPHWAP